MTFVIIFKPCKVVSECGYVARFFLAAYITHAFFRPFLGAGGVCHSLPFAPVMSCGNDLFFRLATRVASTIFLAILSTSRGRGNDPFSPVVRVFPYRIERYVGTHRIGQDVPHPFTVCVERKPHKPRTLLGRKRQFSYCLSVLDRYIRNLTAALRVESNGKELRFVFTAVALSRLPGLFTAVGIARNENARDKNRYATQNHKKQK